MDRAALNGVKVVEFATMVSGPYCGKLFADMGADVIKVEPSSGDPARLEGPFPGSNPHPECSGLFLYNNTSKKGITLDLDSSEGLDSFKQLLKWADVLIDNHSPEVLETLGLDWSAMHNLNPALIYTSITPYGRTGPRSGVKGDELTIMHAGGLGNLLPTRSVDLNRAPVKMGGYQVGYHGGLTAALTTLALLMGRKKSSRGQLIDISLQEVILSMVQVGLAGTRYHNTTWCRVPDRPPAMGRMKTRDGYVILAAMDDHHFSALQDIMGNPGWLADNDWNSRYYRTNHLMDVAPLFEEWMLGEKKHDIHHKAAKKGIPIGPINTAEDVMNSEQYVVREYFVEVDHPLAGKHKYAGWPYKMTASPPRVTRPAPLLGQHNEEILKDPGALPAIPQNRHSSDEGKTKQSNNRLPLQGIRILEFCWVWAGPYTNMLLANLGAEVIKIEGHKRTDLMRRSIIWPLHEPAPIRIQQNQGMSLNSVNRNKKGATIDLATPEGIQLAKRLAIISDAVVDNLRAGAMDKMGLGYSDLRRLKQDIVVVSCSGRGQQGPERDYRGYAMIHQGIGGGAYLNGYPDDHPGSSGGDVDLMNATATAYATLAALYHRIRTGEGQFVDFSQCEGASSVIGEALLGYEMNSEIPERMGNTHPRYAPHNLYKCWGVDRWVALEIHTDEEFAILARTIDKPELAENERFLHMASRKGNEAELDSIIESWTGERDRDWIVNELCKAGLAAAPSRNAKDLYADPHLRARQAFMTINHPEIGEFELVGAPWKMSDCKTPAVHAPLLGEHNEYVFKGLLGLSDEEMADLRKREIIM